MKFTLHSIVVIGCVVSPLVAGAALARSDYDAASGTLTFPPGVWSQTITITVKTDRTREPDETFTVELFSTFGGSVDDAVATGTILNDD
jgi:hypothetical protein